MAITSTNFTDISYVEESTLGVTPATPTFQLLPTTGGSPMGNLTTVISEVIRSDRQTDDLIVVDEDTGGEIEFELTYDAWKPLLIAALQSSTPQAGDTWRNGADIPKSYTFLKRVFNNGSVSYFYYRGCQVSEISLNIESGSLVTGTMTLVGLREDPTDTEIPGSDYTDVADYTLLNAATSVTKAEIGGVVVPAQFMSTVLTLNNNIEGAKRVGNLGSFDLASFTLEVGGDISIYFEDIGTYQLYRNSTQFTIEIEFTDGDGNIFNIFLPKCKFNELEPPIDGKDEFLMLDGNYSGLRDATDDYMIQFAFTDAP